MKFKELYNHMGPWQGGGSWGGGGVIVASPNILLTLSLSLFILYSSSATGIPFKKHFIAASPGLHNFLIILCHHFSIPVHILSSIYIF